MYCSNILQFYLVISCGIILIILSLSFRKHVSSDDIVCHAQVFLQDCIYTLPINKRLICDALDFIDTEPESESEETYQFCMCINSASIIYAILEGIKACFY